MTVRRGHFGDRIHDAVVARQSCLVVGLDPDPDRLPDSIPASGTDARGLADRVETFLSAVVDVVADLAVAVKPNVAFFERFGAAGVECLVRVAARARDAGLAVITDAKRGDIGHTAEAYADALLGRLEGTPGPVSDAVTVNPYLGRDGVEPFLGRVRGDGRGVFVLVRTSNESAREVQDLDVGGEPLCMHVARRVAEWGAGLEGEHGLNPVGAVVGATAVESGEQIRSALPRALFLVPGVGAQGGDIARLRPLFVPGGQGVLVNASRSILYPRGSGGVPWTEPIRDAAARLRDRLEDVRSER